MTTAALLERHRPALTGHCYRMLGSVVDAEDAVQEAMLRAWKGMDRFQEQSSLKTWLYRIATNVCLDALAAAKRRRLRPLETTDAPVLQVALNAGYESEAAFNRAFKREFDLPPARYRRLRRSAPRRDPAQQDARGAP